MLCVCVCVWGGGVTLPKCQGDRTANSCMSHMKLSSKNYPRIHSPNWVSPVTDSALRVGMTHDLMRAS